MLLLVVICCNEAGGMSSADLFLQAMDKGYDDAMVANDMNLGNDDTPAPEIALVRYNECQLAAVFGLTDVFRVANEQLELLGRDRQRVRVSHWEWSGDELRCTYDSHPGNGQRPHSRRLSAQLDLAGTDG